ncbi:hypothetical protein AMATHDRAFT_51752 [Amanita thiersii Skay4041]|uniref:Ricin B lectin domain-containing protein n=1 Tax=Amanita thiersii Skay4041 TaxID=703135 RepID=A0A2A9NC93_9AGAR|nr:hypothetical protein AMATHDRAFT_51752 [Amanita thiersii Skay4041]
MEQVSIPLFFPQGLYVIQSTLSPNYCLTQDGYMTSKNASDQAQQWHIAHVQHGGKLVYMIKNQSTLNSLRVKFEPASNPNTDSLAWIIDTQFGEFMYMDTINHV